MGCERRLVLSPKELGDVGGEATQDYVGRIDNVPAASDVAGFWTVGAHGAASFPLVGTGFCASSFEAVLDTFRASRLLIRKTWQQLHSLPDTRIGRPHTLNGRSPEPGRAARLGKGDPDLPERLRHRPSGLGAHRQQPHNTWRQVNTPSAVAGNGSSP